MSSFPEIIPADHQTKLLIGGVVLPTLEQVAKEKGCSISLATSIMVGDIAARISEPLMVGRADQQTLVGEIRLRFREAFGGRILMHCECVIQKNNPMGNWSGFSLRGELQSACVKRTAWTMRYSVWDWKGWN
jgi:hypothetical protein